MVLSLASDRAVADREPGVVTFPATTVDPASAPGRSAALALLHRKRHAQASWPRSGWGCARRC